MTTHEDNAKKFLDFSSLEKLVFVDLHWYPESRIQAESRITRVVREKQRPKIVRDGRYYVKDNMVGLDLPCSFKFRTKRAAIKYWSRSPIILRGMKQCAATSPYAKFFGGTTTGRISSSTPGMPHSFYKLNGGMKKGELFLIAARSGGSRFLDVEDATALGLAETSGKTQARIEILAAGADCKSHKNSNE